MLINLSHVTDVAQQCSQRMRMCRILSDPRLAKGGPIQMIRRMHVGAGTRVRLLAGMSLACAMLSVPATAQQGPFRFQEATIDGVPGALGAGQLNCREPMTTQR